MTDGRIKTNCYKHGRHSASKSRARFGTGWRDELQDWPDPPSIPSSSSTPSSSKSSINFILNDDVENVDPKTLIKLPIDDFKKKQNEVCELITNKIINIYEATVKDQVKSELLRRSQFNNLILLLKYYEKLEVFCNLHLIRDKGKTVKTQVIKMIVRSSKSSKNKPPYIKNREMTAVLSQAARIR